jgi:hypothetical protein
MLVRVGVGTSEVVVSPAGSGVRVAIEVGLGTVVVPAASGVGVELGTTLAGEPPLSRSSAADLAHPAMSNPEVNTVTTTELGTFIGRHPMPGTAG